MLASGILFGGGIPAAWAAASLVQCNGMKDLVFVPHQDDDLLFMNPDIESTIDAGGCVQVVYLTASERGEGEPYMLGRERGVRAAYAYMAQEPNLWTEDVASYRGRRYMRFTLNGNRRIQLLAMRLKDPWLGRGWGSLTPLSEAESVPGKTADSLGPYAGSYTRQQLVEAISDIIADYQPSTVRHMDDTIQIPYTELCWRCAGHDHPDHIASARLVRDAIRQDQGSYAEVAYVDYPSQERVANLSPQETREKSEAFKRYAWNDYRYCASAEHCLEPAGPAAAWVGRLYYVARPDAAPVLLPDNGGGLRLFATGELSRAASFWDTARQGWQSLGGRTADPIVAFTYQDDRPGVFARDGGGMIWTSRQDAQGVWQRWQRIPGERLVHMPAVTVRGPLWALGMGNDGLFHASEYRGATSGWSPWVALPELREARPQAVLADCEGGLVAFAADRGGRLWASVQAAAAAPEGDPTRWAPWHALPLDPAGGGLAATCSGAADLTLYYRNNVSSHMMATRFHGTIGDIGRGWQPPQDLGFAYKERPVPARDESGQVIVGATDTEGAIWLLENGKAMRTGDTAISPPALHVVGNALYMAARAAGGRQTYWLKARRNGHWEAPLQLIPPPAEGGRAFTQAVVVAGETPAATMAAAAGKIAAAAAVQTSQ